MNLDEIGKHLHEYRLSHNLSLRAFCKKYELSAETVSKIENGCEIGQDVKLTCQAIAEIKKSQPEIGIESGGFIECPKCKGSLMYTYSSYNGHIWGKCKTENCLSWMQ